MMMSTFATVSLSLALLSLCSAKDPSPPMMNGTFKGNGTVRVDLGDKNITGTCAYVAIFFPLCVASFLKSFSPF